MIVIAWLLAIAFFVVMGALVWWSVTCCVKVVRINLRYLRTGEWPYTDIRDARDAFWVHEMLTIQRGVDHHHPP